MNIYKKTCNISDLKKIGWYTAFSKFLFGKIIATLKGK